jgi:hypothetical protein
LSNGFAAVELLLRAALGDVDLGIRLARVSIIIVEKVLAKEE